ncbi:nucleoside triphosphate pyrophosphohydrolase [bacterium]|nr:nucleoside triphosphate pyrophosphohydrolase [bacterium]
MANNDENGKFPSIAKLAEVMARLRHPETGCPWDLEQDHSSLKPYIIEEVYEVISAIDKGDMQALKCELGDLLLHIVFHAQLASERGDFDLDDVAASEVDKIIRRHPHVFGDKKVDSSEQVKQNWEAIKITQEKRGLLSGVPEHLPALLQAYRVQEKAGDVGFEWEDVSGVERKLTEEIAEFKKARRDNDLSKMEEEFGDILFVLVNLGRYLGINAELALKKTVDKFIRRFQFIEEKLAERGRAPHQSTLKEMDSLWDEAKLLFRKDS